MPTWIREVLVSVSAVAITLLAFAAAITVGALISTELAIGSWLVGALAATAFLLFVVLPLRLWWVMKNARP